jgi:hypothetical protein
MKDIKILKIDDCPSPDNMINIVAKINELVISVNDIGNAVWTKKKVNK